MSATVAAERTTLCSRLDSPHGLFGNVAVLVFVIVQCLDGALTYLGVHIWGLSIEANPLVSSAVSMAGVGTGLAATKLFAVALGMMLHLRRVHLVVALLAGVLHRSRHPALGDHVPHPQLTTSRIGRRNDLRLRLSRVPRQPRRLNVPDHPIRKPVASRRVRGRSLAARLTILSACAPTRSPTSRPSSNRCAPRGCIDTFASSMASSAPRPSFDHATVVNLSSNNYLGLTTHPRLRAAAIEAIERLGVGSGSVRTIAGTMAIHMELEERLAQFKKTEAAVVFQSGFTANAGTVSSILTKDDVVISDELNHASIIDGSRLSRATIKVFPHKDVDAARAILRSLPAAQRKLLITDGVFSMDGDLGPLPDLCALAEEFQCIMMVDDAHASGVFGAQRPRHRRSLRRARARGHSGGHALESHRRAGWLRGREPVVHRISPSSSSPVSLLHLASAVGGCLVHRRARRPASRSRRSSIGSGTTRAFSKPGSRRSASTPARARAPSHRSSSATARSR